MRIGGERPLETEEQAFFRELYQSHYAALVSCACQLGFPREAAEDYVQDAFLAAIRHIADIRLCANPRGYLQQILKNVIGYRLRSLRYALELQRKLEERELLRAGPPPDALPPEALYRGAIGDRDLRLLTRFYLEGWSQKDLAGELGISENAVKMRLKHARERMRRALEEDGE